MPSSERCSESCFHLQAHKNFDANTSGVQKLEPIIGGRPFQRRQYVYAKLKDSRGHATLYKTRLVTISFNVFTTAEWNAGSFYFGLIMRVCDGLICLKVLAASRDGEIDMWSDIAVCNPLT